MTYSKKSFKNTFDEIVKIPHTSGLYYFYDKIGNLLYIGRAKVLKSRIKDHRKCNNLDRESKFYSILLERSYPPENQKRLDRQIEDFKFRCENSITVLAIDRIFHKVTRIDIQEMPYEEAKKLELEMIEKLEPPLNSQTGSDVYDELT